MRTDVLEAAIVEATTAPYGSMEVTFQVKATTIEDGNVVEDASRGPTRAIGVRVEFGNKKLLKVIYPPNVDETVRKAIEDYAKRLVATMNRVDPVVQCMLPGDVVAAHTEAP